MRVFYNRRLLTILSILLIIVSFSSVMTNDGLRSLLFQKQAEIFLMQSSREKETKITKPNFALYFPEQLRVKEGEIFTLPLYLLTKEPVESFTAYFTFDPQVLSVQKLSPANNFQRYPEIFHDNTQGLVKLTGETDQAFQGDQEVIWIDCLAKKAGTTQVYFSSNEEGDLSHILQKGVNVIEAVGDAEVLVQD